MSKPTIPRLTSAERTHASVFARDVSRYDALRIKDLLERRNGLFTSGGKSYRAFRYSDGYHAYHHPNGAEMVLARRALDGGDFGPIVLKLVDKTDLVTK